MIGQPWFEIGRGVLNWPRVERIGDRYGAVVLLEEPLGDPIANFDKVIPPVELKQPPDGELRGWLVAVVEETRQSGHLGDVFDGVRPKTPEVGEEILLGSGTLFFEGPTVGLSPDDGRKTRWLDIRKLYRAHDQTVALYFVSGDDWDDLFRERLVLEQIQADILVEHPEIDPTDTLMLNEEAV